MTTATRHLHPRIALVFDFDATLAPSSTDTLIESLGVDPGEFRERYTDPLEREGWDALLAQAYGFLRLSREQGGSLTRAHVEGVGRSIRPYEGVPEMFGRVRRWARDVLPEIEVEFYLLTSGWADMHRCTPIAHEFAAIWGSELHFGEGGELAFAKQIVTYAEKDRYLLALSKGLDTAGDNSPANVYRHVPEAELHVPFDQMMYLGDGGSDMPAFELLNEHGGVALGVYKQGEHADDWKALSRMRPGRRVENLAAADYREGSELMRSIQLAVESICRRIALRTLSRGE